MKIKKNKVVFIIAIIAIMISMLVGCGNNTSYEGTTNIAEASQIAEIYLSDENVFILDVRGREAYEKGHLKNAICLATSNLVVDKPVANTIAPKAKVERVLSDLGITNDSTIYIYDDNGGVSASRVWWTLKVYGHENVMVINNGSDSLVKLGLEITKKENTYEKSDYIAKDADLNLIADFEYVKEISEDLESEVKIIDVRSIAEYDAGSIPNAVLYPHSNNLYKDGSFMSARDTFLFYTAKGINRDDEIILYCKSSFRATQTLLLLEEAGYENVRIYDGAWLEWELNGGLSDVKEDDVPITEQDAS